MTIDTRVFRVRAPDGRCFEMLVRLGETITLDGVCFQIRQDGSEIADTREVFRAMPGRSLSPEAEATDDR